MFLVEFGIICLLFGIFLVSLVFIDKVAVSMITFWIFLLGFIGFLVHVLYKLFTISPLIITGIVCVILTIVFYEELSGGYNEND